MARDGGGDGKSSPWALLWKREPSTARSNDFRGIRLSVPSDGGPLRRRGIASVEGLKLFAIAFLTGLAVFETLMRCGSGIGERRLGALLFGDLTVLGE
jgi:hypothetical protein